MDLKKYIRSIPDYPKKGILFRDITTLIKDSTAFNLTIDKIVEISKVIKTHIAHHIVILKNIVPKKQQSLEESFKSIQQTLLTIELINFWPKAKNSNIDISCLLSV